MQHRKVSDSVPHVKSRGAKLSNMKPTPGVPAEAAPGAGDPSDYSHGHDAGGGQSAPATSHKGPDRTK